MYYQRNTVSCRLVEEPEYSEVERGRRLVPYAALKCYTIKPIRDRKTNTKRSERIEFTIHAFDKNASSIYGKVFADFPLIIEFEIRNIDFGDSSQQQCLEAVKIHFPDQRPHRFKSYRSERVREEEEKDEEVGNDKIDEQLEELSKSEKEGQKETVEEKEE